MQKAINLWLRVCGARVENWSQVVGRFHVPRQPAGSGSCGVIALNAIECSMNPSLGLWTAEESTFHRQRYLMLLTQPYKAPINTHGHVSRDTDEGPDNAGRPKLPYQLVDRQESSKDRILEWSSGVESHAMESLFDLECSRTKPRVFDLTSGHAKEIVFDLESGVKTQPVIKGKVLDVVKKRKEPVKVKKRGGPSKSKDDEDGSDSSGKSGGKKRGGPSKSKDDEDGKRNDSSGKSGGKKRKVEGKE
ncbi:hypothetical protein BGX31_004094 [Mortierella sp. GBA43]|nr:hypothetical protein BGX31_004094 [Mortierella sp. GBA43]